MGKQICESCEGTGLIEVLYSRNGEPAYRDEECEDCDARQDARDLRAEAQALDGDL